MGYRVLGEYKMDKQRINVLMVGNDPSVKGGISSVICQMRKYNWNDKNIKMKFVPTYIQANNLRKVIFFGKAYIKIKKILKKENVDVVHIHMSYKGSFTRAYMIHKLCLKYNVSDLIHLHGSEFKEWFEQNSIKKRTDICKCLREAKGIIVLGNKWDNYIRTIEPRAKTYIIYNSVEVPSESVRWKMPFRFLYMGVLIKRKGVKDLLQAIVQLKKSGEIDGLEFIIAGTGNEEKNLLEYCKKMEINDYVSFIGWVEAEKKKEIFLGAQAMVLPSYNEGLPISILEAMGYAMPVISTDVGDISTVLKNDINGKLIHQGNIDELKKAIIDVAKSKERYECMSNAAKTTIIERFSQTQYFGKIISCYKEII